jgi:spore coat polysaccharide biosynthesis protein SpsF
LALADELRQSHGITTAFALNCDDSATRRVTDHGFEVYTEQGEQGIHASFRPEIFTRHRYIALLLDVRDHLPKAFLEKLRRNGKLIVTIDDPSERRLLADLAFYPPVRQVQDMDWSSFRGRLFSGWDWVLLRKEFRRTEDHIRADDPPGKKRVLVTMGGSDPAGLTVRIVRILQGMTGDFEMDVVVGPGYGNFPELQRLCSGSAKVFRLTRDVTHMAPLMAGCQGAVATFGMTAYELAAAGVPALYLSLSRDHFESCRTFVEAGIAESAGIHEELSDTDLESAVSAFLRDERRLKERARRARRLIDGRGAQRVADVIANELCRRRREQP